MADASEVIPVFGKKKEDDSGDAAGAQEDVAADFKPLVKLEQVEVKTHEEDEEIVFQMRSKLYVFVKEDVYGGEVRQNFWRERGTGDVKLLRHKVHNKIRLLMRQEKTLKICANHLISPHLQLEPNVGSDRSYVFTAADFADEQVKTETFAIKFGSSENAIKFKEAVEKAKLVNAGEGADTTAATAAPTDSAAASDDKVNTSVASEVDEIDKLIQDRNKKEQLRRDSVRLLSAQADSDHDSDEEDVSEQNEDRLHSTVTTHLSEKVDSLKVSDDKPST